MWNARALQKTLFCREEKSSENKKRTLRHHTKASLSLSLSLSLSPPREREQLRDRSRARSRAQRSRTSASRCSRQTRRSTDRFACFVFQTRISISRDFFVAPIWSRWRRVLEEPLDRARVAFELLSIVPTPRHQSPTTLLQNWGQARLRRRQSRRAMARGGQHERHVLENTVFLWLGGVGSMTLRD